MLPDEAFTAGFAVVVVGFATVAAGTGAASGLVVGDAGDGGNDFAGRTVSAPLVSLATLATGVGTEGAVAVTAGVGVAVSVAGGFVETTAAAGGGQRWP